MKHKIDFHQFLVYLTLALVFIGGACDAIKTNRAVFDPSLYAASLAVGGGVLPAIALIVQFKKRTDVIPEQPVPGKVEVPGSRVSATIGGQD